MTKFNRSILIFLVSAIAFLLIGCSTNESAYVEVEMGEGYKVEWYYEEPIPDSYNSFSYLITFQGERVAILTDFPSVNVDGAGLNQTKRVKEEKLQFTLISFIETEVEPDIVLKVNGDILDHKAADIKGFNYSNDLPKQLWFFEYEKDGLTGKVVLTFEGLNQ